MFTIADIKAAHSKVKTGADYPSYVQDIIKLGVAHYETFVNDNHTDYTGVDGTKASSQPSGEWFSINNKTDLKNNRTDLKKENRSKKK